MSNKLTDAEVKKALECMCGIRNNDIEYQIDCLGCAFDNDGLCHENCSEGIAKATLDLINRKDQENESLKAEVERLKRELNLVIENSLSTRFPHCVLCDDTAILTKNLEGYDKFIADIKAEAYKEFAEKIKEKTKWLFSSVSINNEVDNLSNELVGDIKEKKKNNK